MHIPGEVGCTQTSNASFRQDTFGSSAEVNPTESNNPLTVFTTCGGACLPPRLCVVLRGQFCGLGSLCYTDTGFQD